MWERRDQGHHAPKGNILKRIGHIPCNVDTKQDHKRRRLPNAKVHEHQRCQRTDGKRQFPEIRVQLVTVFAFAAIHYSADDGIIDRIPYTGEARKKTDACRRNAQNVCAKIKQPLRDKYICHILPRQRGGIRQQLTVRHTAFFSLLAERIPKAFFRFGRFG